MNRNVLKDNVVLIFVIIIAVNSVLLIAEIVKHLVFASFLFSAFAGKYM